MSVFYLLRKILTLSKLLIILIIYYNMIRWNSHSTSVGKKTRRTYVCSVSYNQIFGSDNYLLTYSMVQSSSREANWFAVSQEIPLISRNPTVHYRTHKRPPPVSILCQPNPVHIPTSHLLESHPNIIHPSTPRYPQWSPSLRFPHQDPTHPPLLTHTFWERYTNGKKYLLLFLLYLQRFNNDGRLGRALDRTEAGWIQ